MRAKIRNTATMLYYGVTPFNLKRHKVNMLEPEPEDIPVQEFFLKVITRILLNFKPCPHFSQNKTFKMKILSSFRGFELQTRFADLDLHHFIKSDPEQNLIFKT